MEEYDKDFYFVAVKVFSRDSNKLLIIHDIFGNWDLPGGRIKTDEFKTPLEAIVKRKMKEEVLVQQVANLSPTKMAYFLE